MHVLRKFRANKASGFNPDTTGITEQIMQRILEDMWSMDVTMVVAAGNDGQLGHSLDEIVPQKLGSPDNALITVGGVYKDGTLDDLTTFDSGAGGSITVYAVSRDVVAADYRNNAGSVTTAPGTSVAAPAVAGLAGK